MMLIHHNLYDSYNYTIAKNTITISKIVVVGLCAALSFFLFSGQIQEVADELPQLNFPLLPTILISLAAYLIASAFFSVYEMAIDTLFLCFLQDLEMNDGSAEKPYYMSADMMRILSIKNKTK